MSERPGRVARLLPPLTPAQQALVIEHGGFARRMTRVLHRRYSRLLDRDDIEQLIQEGLAEAARTYRPEERVPFEAFAYKRACGLVIRAAGREVGVRRLARQAADACAACQDDGDALADSDETTRTRFVEITERIMMAMAFGLARPAVTGAPQGEGDVVAQETRARAQRALETGLARMSAEDRAILDGYYHEDRELKAIADELRLGYSTVRRRHNDALTKLAGTLARAGVDEAPP